jgi:hypothetical protein
VPLFVVYERTLWVFAREPFDDAAKLAAGADAMMPLTSASVRASLNMAFSFGNKLALNT